MIILDKLLLLCVELYVRSLIIVWVLYLTNTKTSLFDNSVIKFVSIIIFFVWIILFPVINYLNEYNSQNVGKEKK